ncbi:MAG: hypothetical protein WCK73_01665 [Deltaproteobacteria bacterium]
MVLLELAAQGVRGFAPERGRIALRPGYNVVSVDGAVLRRLIAAVLHPELPADPSFRADFALPGTVRAGITLAGDDGVTWRVVRDLSGPCQLQRYDAERRAFQSLLQEPARIAEALRTAGVPSSERLEAVLTIAAADFPSRQAPAGLGGTARAPESRRVSASHAEARRRLEEVRAEIEQVKRAEEIQRRMDVLQSRLFQLEEALRSGEQWRERLRDAEAEVEPLGGSAAALSPLGDPAAAIAAAAKSLARRDEAVARVATERDGLVGAETEGPEPLLRHWGFVGGLAVGAVALGVGLAVGPGLVALAAIPATGWAAITGLGWIRRSEAAEDAGRRARRLAERERKAVELWDRETAQVRAAQAAVGVEDLRELEALVVRVSEASRRLVEARAAMEAWKGEAGNRDAEAERLAVLQEIGGLESELAAGSRGFVPDALTLEREVEWLEREVETGPFQTVPEERVATSGEAAPGADPLRMLVERASAEMGLSIGASLRALQSRVTQLLPILSAQRFSQFFVDERGNVQVQAAGKLQPTVGLGRPERDLCFAVLKVAFLEQGLAAGRAVGLLEDAFAPLPEGSRRAIARVLKQLARGRQIVHGSSDVLFREAADHAS